jgi:glycosyltransferase involved in cell wall biosynthesis
MNLTIIVPAHDEAEVIGGVAERVARAGRRLPIACEVIAVDEGSGDATAERLLAAEARHPGLVRSVIHPRNRGKGAAIRSGLEVASGDVVLIQDADFEYDPADYAKLLKPLLEGRADVVYGSRFRERGEARVGAFWHTLANRFLTTVSNVFTNLDLTDMETGYKAFRREVLEGVDLVENGFGFEPEFTAKIAHRGLRIYEVPISYNPRGRTEGKKIGWKDGVRALWCIVKYNVPALLRRGTNRKGTQGGLCRPDRPAEEDAAPPPQFIEH